MKLPLRLCESQYLFQYKMDLNFENLTNAHIIADNVLIVGSDLGPDPRKIQAISNMPVSSNKTELQSYIGMCNFLSSYVPHLTDRLYALQ